MTRQGVIDKLGEILKKVAKECGCKIYIRRNYEASPLSIEDMACIVLNDYVCLVESANSPLGLMGGVNNCKLSIIISTLSYEEAESLSLMYHVCCALGYFEKTVLSQDGNTSDGDFIIDGFSIDLNEHNFVKLRHEDEISVFSLSIDVNYCSGRWEI